MSNGSAALPLWTSLNRAKTQNAVSSSMQKKWQKCIHSSHQSLCIQAEKITVQTQPARTIGWFQGALAVSSPQRQNKGYTCSVAVNPWNRSKWTEWKWEPRKQVSNWMQISHKQHFFRSYRSSDCWSKALLYNYVNYSRSKCHHATSILSQGTWIKNVLAGNQIAKSTFASTSHPKHHHLNCWEVSGKSGTAV